MAYITLIIEFLKAFPKLIDLVKGAMDAIQKQREQTLIDETKKADKNGDTKTVETNIGSPRAGQPSGLDGVVRRPKKAD